MSGRSFVVLGAGPAGLGAGLWLAERGFGVDVVERKAVVGGNAGSFEVGGLRADYGSHRLHPSTDPELLALLRDLLGEDLLKRPRHGRIRLSGRWIHFPLRPLDLLVHAPPAFALGVAGDLARKVVPGPAPAAEETFGGVLRRGLGATICREFYFPFARKIWGLEPEELSPIQARRRVSAGSLGKMLKRLRPAPRGDERPGAPKSWFLYPREGFGQISESLHRAALSAGARVALRTSVDEVARRDGGGFDVTVSTDGEAAVLSTDALWSTIPAPVLVTLLRPVAPAEVLEAAGRLELRAMVLVYLVLERDRFTEYDAHYFPGTDIPFTRLSEPKNYSDRTEPAGRTVLCAEIPCSTTDETWRMDDAALGELVIEGLGAAGLPSPRPVVEVVTRRLGQAYPIYRRGYEAHFERVDRWLQGVDDLLSFGRQGLFAHDNTHHTLFMARSAVRCVRDDGAFDTARWEEFRRVFETHVVED